VVVMSSALLDPKTNPEQPETTFAMLPGVVPPFEVAPGDIDLPGYGYENPFTDDKPLQDGDTAIFWSKYTKLLDNTDNPKPNLVCCGTALTIRHVVRATTDRNLNAYMVAPVTQPDMEFHASFRSLIPVRVVVPPSPPPFDISKPRRYIGPRVWTKHVGESAPTSLNPGDIALVVVGPTRPGNSLVISAVPNAYASWTFGRAVYCVRTDHLIDVDGSRRSRRRRIITYRHKQTEHSP
jgi:hypothetical protein